MTINKFYVYRHIRLDTNTPFYVGKGSSKRAWSFHKRNSYHKAIIEKHEYNVEIMIDNLTEVEAFRKEKEFILFYKKLGFCEANFSFGGEGNSGWKHSEETKRKISRKGHLNPNYGNKMSEESKYSISRLNKIKVKKWHFQTPKGIYQDATDASIEFKVSSRTIYSWCRQEKTGFKLIKL